MATFFARIEFCFAVILALIAACFFFMASFFSFAEISTFTSYFFSSGFYPPCINSLRYSPIWASFLSPLHADFTNYLGNLCFKMSVTGALGNSLLAYAIQMTNFRDMKRLFKGKSFRSKSDTGMSLSTYSLAATSHANLSRLTSIVTVGRDEAIACLTVRLILVWY